MHDSTQKPRRGENHDGSHSVPTLAQDEDTQPPFETEDVHMLTQKVRTWDVLQGHPIAQRLDDTTRLALLCEYLDLTDELEGMLLSEFITAFLSSESNDEETEAAVEAKPAVTTKSKSKAKAKVADEDDVVEPSDNGDGADTSDEAGGIRDDRKLVGSPAGDTPAKPTSLVGLRVVYRFPGRNVLSDEEGVTRDSAGTVAFTDVDGVPWSNVHRYKVHPIDAENYREVHIIPREAREIEGWLNGGKPVKGHPEGTVLRNMAVEFPEFPDKIIFAIVNGKRPFVDRFVELPEKGFEDDQKPTTRLFGEHCFRVNAKDYVVKVVTP